MNASGHGMFLGADLGPSRFLCNLLPIVAQSQGPRHFVGSSRRVRARGGAVFAVRHATERPERTERVVAPKIAEMRPVQSRAECAMGMAYNGVASW